MVSRPDLPTLPALDRRPRVYHTRRPRSGTPSATGHYQWLVDLDAPAAAPGGSGRSPSSAAADHLGDRRHAALQGQRAALPAPQRGVDLAGDRVLMLANARVFGHVFDPLTVYWCFDRRRPARARVLAEVHNTYGERHAYVLQPRRRRAGPASTRSSTSRRSSPSTAATSCSSACPTSGYAPP